MLMMVSSTRVKSTHSSFGFLFLSSFVVFFPPRLPTRKRRAERGRALRPPPVLGCAREFLLHTSFRRRGRQKVSRDVDLDPLTCSFSFPFLLLSLPLFPSRSEGYRVILLNSNPVSSSQRKEGKEK